jgi:PAS domain S-box-containing protein
VKIRFLSLSLTVDDFCHSLVHDAPDAIIFADAGGMIRFWNRGAERLFGFIEEEAPRRETTRNIA